MQIATEYLVTLNKKVSKVCRNNADLLSFCINHLYDFNKPSWLIEAMPILPNGHLQDLTYQYEFKFDSCWLDYELKGLNFPNTKPFANRKGSFINYVIE